LNPDRAFLHRRHESVATSGENAMAKATFITVLEAEAFAILDDTGTSDTNGLTVFRTPLMPERPKQGLNALGLWDGYGGDGYVDMGGQAGDAVVFTVTAPEAGIYAFSFRYANGGVGDRPMTLARQGETRALIDFAATLHGTPGARKRSRWPLRLATTPSR